MFLEKRATLRSAIVIRQRGDCRHRQFKTTQRRTKAPSIRYRDCVVSQTLASFSTIHRWKSRISLDHSDCATCVQRYVVMWFWSVQEASKNERHAGVISLKVRDALSRRCSWIWRRKKIALVIGSFLFVWYIFRDCYGQICLCFIVVLEFCLFSWLGLLQKPPRARPNSFWILIRVRVSKSFWSTIALSVCMCERVLVILWKSRTIAHLSKYFVNIEFFMT